MTGDEISHTFHKPSVHLPKKKKKKTSDPVTQTPLLYARPQHCLHRLSMRLWAVKLPNKNQSQASWWKVHITISNLLHPHFPFQSAKCPGPLGGAHEYTRKGALSLGMEGTAGASGSQWHITEGWDNRNKNANGCPNMVGFVFDPHILLHNATATWAHIWVKNTPALATVADRKEKEENKGRILSVLPLCHGSGWNSMLLEFSQGSFHSYLNVFNVIVNRKQIMANKRSYFTDLVCMLTSE